jgi:hypothetical protein
VDGDESSQGGDESLPAVLSSVSLQATPGGVYVPLVIEVCLGQAAVFE